jgi:hypothetical protein
LSDDGNISDNGPDSYKDTNKVDAVYNKIKNQKYNTLAYLNEIEGIIGKNNISYVLLTPKNCIKNIKLYYYNCTYLDDVFEEFPRLKSKFNKSLNTKIDLMLWNKMKHKM